MYNITSNSGVNICKKFMVFDIFLQILMHCIISKKLNNPWAVQDGWWVYSLGDWKGVVSVHNDCPQKSKLPQYNTVYSCHSSWWELSTAVKSWYVACLLDTEINTEVADSEWGECFGATVHGTTIQHDCLHQRWLLSHCKSSGNLILGENISQNFRKKLARLALAAPGS